MAFDTVNRLLRQNIGNVNRLPTKAVDVNVELLDTTIQDKLNELAAHIADSDNRQLIHDKQVLDLTINAAVTEFKQMLDDKLRNIDTNVTDKLSSAFDAAEMSTLVHDVLGTAAIDDTLSALQRDTIAQSVNINTVIKKYVDSQITHMFNANLPRSIAAQHQALVRKFDTVFSRSFASTANEFAQLHILADNLFKIEARVVESNEKADANLRALKVHNISIDPKMSKLHDTLQYGNIFQRISAEFKLRNMTFRRAVVTDTKRLINIALMPFRPVRTLKKFAKTVADEQREIWSNALSFFVGKSKERIERDKRNKEQTAAVAAEKTKTAVKEKELLLRINQSKLLRVDVLYQIRQLHKKIHESYNYIDNFDAAADTSNVIRTYAGGSTASKSKLATKTKVNFTKILSTAIGAGVIAAIAIGIYKLWPTLKKMFTFFGESRINAIDPTLPSVPDFTTFGSYTATTDTVDMTLTESKRLIDTTVADVTAEIDTIPDIIPAELESLQQPLTDITEISETDELITIQETMSEDTDDSEQHDEPIEPDKNVTVTDINSVIQDNIDTLDIKPAVEQHAADTEQHDDQLDTANPQSIGARLFGSVDKDAAFTEHDIEQFEHEHERELDDKLEQDDAAKQLRDDMSDMYDELQDIIQTYATTHAEILRDIDSVNKQGIAYKVIDRLDEAVKRLDPAILEIEQRKANKLNVKKSQLNKLAKNVDAAVKQIELSQQSQLTQIDKLNMLENMLVNKLTDTDTEEAANIVLVDSATLEQLQSQLTNLSTTIADQINIIANSTTTDTAKAASVKKVLDTINPDMPVASYAPAQ